MDAPAKHTKNTKGNSGKAGVLTMVISVVA